MKHLPVLAIVVGEGAPEQGSQPLRASGVFPDPLEPRLEPLRASIRAFGASIRGPISP